MLKLICVGKLKERYWREAVAEYVKRLGRYCRIEIAEVPDASVPDNPSQAQIEAVLEREAVGIRKHLKPQMHVVSLCVEGKQWSSEDFAEYIKKQELSGSIAFIIGGSHGLADEIKRLSHFCLSFSKMTLPHQMMRAVFLEQLYRACKINAGESYHK